jgi:hypothetical protein
MMAIDQRSNEQTPTEVTPCYRRESRGMAVLLVVAWLLYSACALGWFILEAPSGMRCVNHVY